MTRFVLFDGDKSTLSTVPLTEQTYGGLTVSHDDVRSYQNLSNNLIHGGFVPSRS